MRRFLNNRYYILAASIAFASVLAYLPTLNNEFVNWDDDLYVYDNPYIGSLNLNFFKWAFFSFHAAFWIPLTWLSYAIDHVFWGLNPLGYHLTNVILHGLNTFLVVVLVARLISIADKAPSYPHLKTRGGGGSYEIRNPKSDDGSRSRFIFITASITGLLFGLHPIHVESVAWASERKDVLYAFFFLMSLITYTKYVTNPLLSPLSLRGDKRGVKQYLLSLCFFLLALLSKPMAVTLPVVLLILDWYPFRRFSVRAGSLSPLLKLKPIFVEKVPFFVLSLVSAGITITGHYFADSLAPLISTPPSTRIFVAFKSLISYLGKILWPINLIPFYPYPKEVSLLSFEYLSSILLVTGITLTCIAVSKKQRIWLAVWAYYTVTLFPVLGLFQAGEQEMADRFTYLPSIGPFLVIGLGVTFLLERLTNLKIWNPPLKIFALSMSAIVVISMSYATIKQIGIWKNSIILWSYVIEKEPQKVPLAHNNRGVAYDKIGRYDRAIEDFNSAITLNPGYVGAYRNRGVAYDKIGQYDRAIQDFSLAITLNPNYAKVYDDRGVAYGRTGQYDRAIQDFNSAITLSPNYAKVYNDRGVAYDRMGQYDRAIKDFSSAIALNPGDALTYSNRGIVYYGLAMYEEALNDFTTAIRLNPNFSELYSYRGNIYRVLGRPEEAERIKIKP